MDVSPETIRTVEFRERLRGYNQDDVDQFLERMAAGVEILQQRLRDASERAARAEERAAQPTEGDDSLRRTLALAQRTADMAVEEAREQAARIVQSAQDEAHSLVSAAQGDARSARDAAQAEAATVMADAEARAAQLIEEAQAQAVMDVRRLEARRDELDGEIILLERHVAEARTRAQVALTEAARQLEHLVADPVIEAAPPATPLPAAPADDEGAVGAGDAELPVVQGPADVPHATTSGEAAPLQGAPLRS